MLQQEQYFTTTKVMSEGKVNILICKERGVLSPRFFIYFNPSR